MSGWRQAYGRATIYPSAHPSNAVGQHRWVTQISPNYKGLNRPAHAEDEKPSEKLAPAAPVIYEGVMADTLRRVKLLSLTTCCLSIVGTSLIVMLHFLSWMGLRSLTSYWIDQQGCRMMLLVATGKLLDELFKAFAVIREIRTFNCCPSQ